MNRGRRGALLAVLLLAALSAGCVTGPGSTGTFEKTLNVSGPIRMEIQNGSGDIKVTPGQPGRVRVRGEYTIRVLFWETLEGRVEEIRNNPPIEQSGNLVRIGYQRHRLRNVTISYTIETPPETEIHAGTGSGEMHITGVRGPAELSTGSGEITAENIGAATTASAGSGDIVLRSIEGEVQAETGSGEIKLETIRGHIRLQTGSGELRVDRPGGRIRAETGSGDITIHGISNDLRAGTGSGGLRIEGNPAAGVYWDLHTGSGDVVLDLPESASFRFHARSNSGDIQSALPLTQKEESRRELRGMAGRGEARIEVQTGSGSIRIR